ncbi:hypothetical protein D3C72_2020630 [compost metagenome]
MSVGAPKSAPKNAASNAATGITSHSEVCKPLGNMAANAAKLSARCGEAIKANR